ETGAEATAPDRRSRRSKTTRPARPRPAVSETDLIAAAERIADQMTAEGVALAPRPSIAPMRSAGYPLRTAQAPVLRRHIHERHTNPADDTGDIETKENTP